MKRAFAILPLLMFLAPLGVFAGKWHHPWRAPYLIRVVDTQGAPVPNAYVVADNGLVCRTDPQGRTVWNETTVMRDGVSFSTQHDGYAPTRAVLNVSHGGSATLTVQSAQGAPDRFADLAFLIGRWEGRSEGQPGNGTVQRTYERALDGRFLRVRNTSTYPPQEKNPKGEVHQDEGFFSVDGARKRIVFRQFHTEGFVNQYVQEPGALVFESEAIENIPPGFKARETYKATGPDSFEETFELAEPGKAYELYSRTRFTRVRP